MQKLGAIHRREGSYIEQQKAEVVANTSKFSNTQLREQHQSHINMHEVKDTSTAKHAESSG